MEDRLRAVEDAVLRISTLLPTLATKTELAELRVDMHKGFAEMQAAQNVQTWRFIGFVGLIAGLFFAAHKVWP